MSLKSQYQVFCNGCNHPYHEETVGVTTRLFHAGTKAGEVNPVMPTKNCIYSYDYVIYSPCKHCCPESFAECPECNAGKIGKPTTTRCRC